MAESQSTVTYRDLTPHGFPGYRVGDDGSVWTAWKQVGRGTGLGSKRVLGDTYRRLKLHVERPSGYHTVGIGGRTIRVHTLVLTAFVGPRPPGMEACHCPDRDPSNNRLDNLRWDTHSANMMHRVEQGTHNRGERHPNTHLTDVEVMRIRELYATGNYTQKQLGDQYGVNRETVSNIVRRVYWKHL